MPIKRRSQLEALRTTGMTLSPDCAHHDAISPPIAVDQRVKLPTLTLQCAHKRGQRTLADGRSIWRSCMIGGGSMTQPSIVNLPHQGSSELSRPRTAQCRVRTRPGTSLVRCRPSVMSTNLDSDSDSQITTQESIGAGNTTSLLSQSPPGGQLPVPPVRFGSRPDHLT